MPDPAASLVTELPFPKYIGIAGEEDGWLALADRESLRNHVGTMHAGALFTLGETASGAAMLRTLAPALAGAMPVAKSASISYRRPARGAIRAMGTLMESTEAIAARLKSEGKTTFDINVMLRDESGTEIATMTVTWHVRVP
jgi:acyl-coenzyme A thioesterase PaaI-like protein